MKEWEETCRNEVINCDNVNDPFAYAACLEKQRDQIANCVKQAGEMIKKCQEATNPGDPIGEPTSPIQE
jgi:hypothetical protein